MDADSLQAMFEMHIKECDGRDARNTAAINKMEGMFKGIWDAQDKMSDEHKNVTNSLRADITTLQIRAALALGGLIVVGIGLVIWGVFQMSRNKAK